MSYVKSKIWGERIFRVGNELHKLEVIASTTSKNLYIISDGKRTTLRSLYLSGCPQEGNRGVSKAIQLNFLRHDGDIHQLLEDDVQCKGCMKLLKITSRRVGSDYGVLTIPGWLEHKVRCGELQQMLRKEYAALDLQGAPKFNPSRAIGTIGSSSLTSTATYASESDASGEEEEQKALARTSRGIEEVIIIFKHVNDLNNQYFHVVSEGKYITAFRFLFLENKARLSGLEMIKLVKQDVDAEFHGDSIRCKGCSRDFNIRRLDNNKVRLDLWANHKFLCKNLQARYLNEFKSGGSIRGSHENAQEKALSERTKQHSPSLSRPMARAAPAPRVTKSESVDQDNTQPFGITGAGPNKKRTFNLVEDSNAEREEFLKCKKRHIDASGDVNEVEIGFPPGFAVAHPDVIFKIMNSFRGAD
ncbi:hypothetical protein SCHPADRAFT_560592 [Schizopora paradoxa]|uniref:Uncharacterized protein n=1 Tax=Schizopora paradoxa TaxID=27342 RepID=A0A0H2RCN3_9AGAM|nr:hypothetical protein SCHPADRAFT_560592 [Schizopora paradoxa]